MPHNTIQTSCKASFKSWRMLDRLAEVGDDTASVLRDVRPANTIGLLAPEPAWTKQLLDTKLLDLQR